MSDSMRSKVFQVRQNSTSLRGTIPQSIVDILNLKHGDTVEWAYEIKDGKIVAIFQKAE